MIFELIGKIKKEGAKVQKLFQQDNVEIIFILGAGKFNNYIVYLSLSKISHFG
jgi:hypothetical protein